MPSFDINTYLNNRLSNRLTNEKMQGLDLATSKKQAELAAQKQEREARLAAEQKAYEDSWVGKLGLEPQGFVANRVNDVASLVSGASRLIGNTVALPNSISSLVDNTKLDEGDIEAFNRYQTNALQAGDMARLALPKEAGASAVFDTIKSSQKNREAARSINNTFDLTRTVEQTNRNQFIGSLKEGFDQPYSQLTDGIQQAKDGNLLDAAGNVSAGVAKLLFNAGSAMVTNGSGVREYVLENAPQLFIGTAGVPGKVAMAASNIGYAIDNYQQGIENFAKTNNGQMPSAARLQEMALQAASLAAAEQAGDMIGLGLGKLAGRAGRSGILNTVKAGAGGAASESLTEGYQTYMEGQITGKPVTASDVYVGGAIGAAAGGVLTGSMRGLQELSGTTPEKIEERKVEGSRQEALTEAIASGNVSALVDPKSSTYAPDQAIAALFGISQRADATPESKQAGLEQASKIVSDLEAQRDSVQDELDNTSPDRLQAKLDANRDSWPAELVAMVEEEIATLKANPADPKAVAALQKKAAKLDALISESQDVLKVFTQESLDKNIDVAAEAAKITAADPVESQSAASRIINLSMASPDSLDTGLASSLAADASNGLTDSQRTYLRTFSEARAAENQLKRMGKVSEEISRGSPKGAKGTRYVGLVNYRSSLATALLARNQLSADRQLELLTKFEASHQGKAQAASEALAAFQNDGINRRIEKDSSGNWSVQEGLWADNKKRVLNGGLNINANATQLVAAVQIEAAAISKTAAELQAAYEVGFSKGTTSGANNVQNVSQAPEGSETASAELQVEAAPQAGTVEGSAGAAGGVSAPAATDAATGASPVVDSAQEAPASAVSTVDTAGDQAQLQSTEQSTATSEEVVPVSEEVATQEAVQPAKVVEPTSSATPVVERSEGLLALQAKSPEGTPHDEKRLGDFFTQAAGKDTDGSKRPLAAVKDFMSAVAAGTVTVAQYVKDQYLSEGAKPQVWAKFVEKAAEWAPEITRNLKVGIDQKFHYLDPIRFLQTLSVDGKTTAEVEENVKTAMSAAIFSYTADQAGRAALNDDTAINGILGRSKDSPVSANAREALQSVGVYQSQVIDSLGLAVMDALGLKLNPNAPQDMLAKMQVSLGGHALKLMEDQGLLVRTALSNGEINRLRTENLFEDSESGNQTNETASVTDNVKGHIFFTLARDRASQPTGTAKEIADAIKGSQSLIQNLFGIESSLTFPSLTPPKGLQKESDTGMGLPGFIKKVFKLNQTRPWKANKDPLKILGFFSEEEGIEMAGVDNATEHTHRRNLNSKRAKNDGLVREFRNFMQFVGDLAVSDKGMEQEFYLSQEMWKQQRSGYKSNAVNPNTSKIVRWLMAPDSWSTDINRNNEKQLQSFMLRVSEGFGIKPEKDASEEAVKDLNSKMKEPAMQEAVKAMQAMLVIQNGDATDQQRSAVLEAVKAGKQNLHTLASLIAYARYQQAVDTKADTFTTNLMGEVDGVSNGSVLNSIMYGAAATAEQLNTLLEKGGIYTLGSKFSQYNLWRGTPGHQDIYESNAQDLHAYANSMPAETRAVTGAIWATAGSPINAAMEATKDGRDLLKGPINPLNYGGGFKSIIGKMAYNYVDTIYEKLEGFSRKGADQATVNEFVRNVNTLLSENKVPLMPVGKSIAFYLGYTLSEAQEAALRNAYSATVGVAAKEVVGKNFKAFLDRSKSVTKTVNLTYGLYEAVYNASRQAMIKELGIPTKRVRVPGSPNSKPEYTNEPIHDLTVAQEAQLAKRLKDILPAMHTAMSKQEGKVENGILLAKKDRKQNNSPAYKVAVEFGSKLKNGASQLTTVGRSMVQTDPGVIAISGTTHALDSAVSHSAQEANHVLNNHDAVGAGINTLAQSAELLNKNTWSKTLNYSPLSEAHDALMRVVQGIVAMDQRGELTPEIKAAIKEKLGEIAKKSKGSNAASIVDVTAFNIFGEAFEANRIKLTAMAQWAVVDQYAMDGGSYQVTAEDRQKALDKLNALSPGRSAADLQALDAFGKSLFGTGAVQATTTAPVAAAPKATITSLFGKIGTPAIKSDADLVTFFEGKPEATAAEVIKLLGAEGRLNSINRKILSLLSRTVSPDLKIKFVTPQTSPDTVLEKPTTSARGWFIAKNGREEIYVLSPEFVDSGLTTETLLHELVHAAVARVIDNPSKEAAALVDELRSLKNEAKKYLLKNRMTGFKAALLEDRDDRKDIQEFVAWGMTDLEFQRDVLSKITMKSKTSSNRLVTGMQKFISALTGLLFKKPDANIDNGLAVLIGNVSGLFYEAASKNNARQTAQPMPVPATPVSSTVAELNKAYDAANQVDAFGAEGIKGNFRNPKMKALVDAYWTVFDKLLKETGSLVDNALNMRTAYAQSLKERLDQILTSEVFDDVKHEALIELYQDVLEYFDEFNQRQSGFNFSMAAPSSNLNLAQETVGPIDAYTTLDIHQALDNGTLEPSFQAQLGNLLTGIVDALHGPFGAFAASMRKTEAGNPLAVWLKAMETGQAPFASAIVASGFAGSAQEDFAMQQVEATVKAAIDRNEALTKIAYKQLSDLYTEVKSKLKPSDFDSQEDYDFVFKLESGNGGRSDYLARFAAMGLANQKFNSMLKFATERDTRRFGEGQTFTQRLENIFEKILAFFSEWTTRTYAGQNVDEKLEALVNQLVDIEAKKRHLIKRQATETNYLAPVEEGVKKAADAARAKVGEIAGAGIIRNNRFATVRAAGSLVRTVADDRVEGFLDGLQRFRDRNFKGRQGITAGLLTDLKGPLEKFALLLRESKRREGERKSIITQYSKQALQTFINQGKDLSKEAKAGISAVFMRTGLHNLIDTMSMADLERVISSRSELEKAITATEAQLNSRLKDRYIEQANALGYYKATGKARSSVLMLNSYLIARMSGTQFQNQVTAQEAKQVEPIIASLASLYALKYSSVQDLTQATQVLRTENNRTDGNGVEFVLKLHKQMEAESLQRLFKGNPALMVHGYTPEILNPYTAIKIADAVEGQDLLAQGYSLGAKVSQDRADPDTSGKRIYVLRDGGLAPYLTGVFSLTGLKAKGSKKHNGYMNVNTQNGLDNAALQADITNEKLSSLQVKKDPKRDLSNDDQNHMVPVYNEMGNIVNWRYMMAEKTKNDLLERDNRFENMLGVFAGSIYDKETTQEQNLKAVTALREQYELEYATRKDSYIEVGEDSSDPEMREIWNLLPDATKQDVRKVWGRKGMKVRVDSLDLMFGYRKLSAAEFLMKDKESLEGMQKIFREWFGIYAKSRGMNEQEADNYAKKIGGMLGRGERGWQEIVSEVKDIIVVKTGVVMLGNIYSNLSFLAMAGVPVKEGLKHHLVAMKAATTYQRDTERLAQLENLLEVGYSQNNDKEIREEIVRLRDSLARNPVRELIEAGLMPTIVEDVAADEDIYSYKSLLARKTERFTDRLNPNVKAAGKFVYMAHDTKMYQSLRRITQLSDFVARYTLYQHLTSRANNPLSQADAIQEASDAFVNYDIPMHRGMQYTDDMGFTPFMKYFLRIQRVLLKLTRENPARVLTTIALNSYMDLGPIVLDSSFTSNIGDNPFKAGAFQLPGALGDLATVNAGMALIK